jgi:hypothetical protein
MFSIRKIFAKKENMEGNIVIKREINQGGEKMNPIIKISLMENKVEQKKIQELQNKIIGQRNNIALAKGIVPDINKRQFIKKGILGIIAGIGIAAFSKIARADGGFINYPGGTDAFRVTSTGILTMPNQPAVMAYNSSSDNNGTGDNTFVTVDYDTEIFDQNADFASDTFTAPVTGRYLIVASIRYGEVTTASDTVQSGIVTSNRTWTDTFAGLPDGVTGDFVIHLTAIADMDAADTVYIRTKVNGESGKPCDIIGNTTQQTSFCAILLA